MHHKPGKANIKANILLRQADHNRGGDDNKDVTILKDKWFRRVETVQKKEIEEETKKEAEQHLERIVPELKGERKQEAVEALATMLQEEWTRSMEVEMRTVGQGLLPCRRLSLSVHRLHNASASLSTSAILPLPMW